MKIHGIRYLLAAMVWTPLVLGGCVVADGGKSVGDELARASLQKVPGCYSVRYHFVEDSEHEFFLEENIEYMDIVPQGEGYLARNFMAIDEDTGFLHWVQEWMPLDNGRWRMRVLDGRGNERYVSEGVWRFNQWEGEPALATKPTRDTPRTDYDVLQRRNAIQFTNELWVQSEINMKLREDGTPVASEVGWIEYRKLPTEDACAPAMEAAGEAASVLMARAAPRPVGW